MTPTAGDHAAATRGVAIVDPGTSDCPALALVEVGEGRVQALLWPGVGSRLRSLHEFVLAAGARTVEQLHENEAVYYVIEGSVEVHDASDGGVSHLIPGSMLHVEPGTPYVFVALEPTRFVGGPCPADDSLYESIIEQRQST